jgi:pimeloyl-ACP methyl ester carboxylesterase
MVRSSRCVPLIYSLIAVALTYAAPALALDQDAAATLSRQYLASDSRAERAQLARRLADYDGPIDPVLRQLSARTYQAARQSYYPHVHFITPELLKRHPRDLLYYLVPNGYRPDRPSGLIIFMHGGGKSTTANAPDNTLHSPTGDMLAATGMVVVGPSAPQASSYYRWCLRDLDQYLLDVILEAKSHFHIDPDRVFLLGHSMGGFGAYHHAQRSPDRYAAVVVNSGSWSRGYWPVIRGTPLCIVQAVDDARPGVRWHYTDVEYGRWTDRILTREGLDHLYLEHEGHHGIGYARPQLAEFFASAGRLRRDPYYRHVVLATPAGFRPSCSFPVRHNRWLTLNEPTKGSIEYDELLAHDHGTFDSWRLEHRVSTLSGSTIEAVNQGGNVIVITTRHVARFTVWLHPQMVDVSRPVRIFVNGRERFDARVHPSLLTALESYERRQDWGLIYPIKVEVRAE